MKESEDSFRDSASFILLFRIFGFIDVSLDLADLFGHRDLLWANFCAIPKGLATPCVFEDNCDIMNQKVVPKGLQATRVKIFSQA